MTQRFAAAITAMCIAACSSPTHRIGGRVRGIWDGADSLSLRLQAPGVDTLLTVPTNGGFQFPDDVDSGASYAVTVAQSPAKHSCEVADGSGKVGDSNATEIAVACTGPAFTVGFSEDRGWKFDATQDGLSFDASLFVDRVVLTDVGGDPADVSAFQSGVVHVFVRTGTTWAPQAYIKASNTGQTDRFGSAVALSGDTLAVGAPNEDSAASGIDPPGGQASEAAQNAGAVYVLRRTGTAWAQEAYVKPSTALAGDGFGSGQSDNSAPEAGAIYLYQ